MIDINPSSHDGGIEPQHGKETKMGEPDREETGTVPEKNQPHERASPNASRYRCAEKNFIEETCHDQDVRGRCNEDQQTA